MFIIRYKTLLIVSCVVDRYKNCIEKKNILEK